MPDYIKRADKPDLAYVATEKSAEGAHLPAVLFCGGFLSDMEGTKATELERLCRERGQGYVRFDYTAHGRSGGQVEDCTIGLWKEDVLYVLDEIVQGPVIIVGSSMGGWLGLLAALARPLRVHGYIGLAAALDFTEDIRTRFSAEQTAQLAHEGRTFLPNDYGDPYLITKNFLEEAGAHLLLGKAYRVAFPIDFIQGMRDADVPWPWVFRNVEAFRESSAPGVILIEDGDHRLSRPEDIALIDMRLRTMNAKATGETPSAGALPDNVVPCAMVPYR